MYSYFLPDFFWKTLRRVEGWGFIKFRTTPQWEAVRGGGGEDKRRKGCEKKKVRGADTNVN
jgi:hypothetical protein